MIIASTCSVTIGTSTSSFLFLRRIQAVYADFKLVTFAFFALWLAQIGLSVLIPLGVGDFFTTECQNADIELVLISELTTYSEPHII